MRDDIWLLSRLDYIWSEFFEDIKQSNKVFIKFGRYSKYRLGSIKLDTKSGASQITVTSMFKNESIPQEVVDHTIAHELSHYTHGFSSNRKREHKHPHAGGVIKSEMEERGVGHLYKAYKLWLKEYKKILIGERILR